MQKTFHIKSVDRTRIYPLGVFFEEDGLRISAVCDGMEETGILLYDRKHRDGVRIPFSENCRVGAVRAMLLSGYRDKTCSYLFYRGEETFQDPYCKRVCNTYGYGAPKRSCPGASPFWRHTTGEMTKTCTYPTRRWLFTPCM